MLVVLLVLLLYIEMPVSFVEYINSPLLSKSYDSTFFDTSSVVFVLILQIYKLSFFVYATFNPSLDIKGCLIFSPLSRLILFLYN